MSTPLERTVVDDFWPQEKTLSTLLRSFRVWVCSYGTKATVGEGVSTDSQLFAAARDVFCVEDAGRGGEDCFLEEAAVQHLHGAVHRRGEHVGIGRGQRSLRHWMLHVALRCKCGGDALVGHFFELFGA